MPHVITRAIDTRGLSRAQALLLHEALEAHASKHSVKAESIYRRLLAQGFRSADVYNNLSSVLIERGLTSPARLLAQKALEIQSDHPEALANLASLYGQQENWQLCLSFSKRAANADKTNPLPRLWHGRSLATLRSRDEAIQYLIECCESGDLRSKDICEAEAALLLLANNQKRESIRLLFKSFKENPNSPSLWEAGTTIARETKKNKTLTGIAESALSRGLIEPDASIYLAKLLIAGDQEAKAILTLLALVKHRPQCDIAWEQLGLILKTQKNYPKAAATFRRAVKENPLRKKSWIELIETLTKASNYTEAEAESRKARRLFPNDMEVVLSLCFSLIEADKISGALSEIEAFVRRYPALQESKELLNCAGLAHLKQRDTRRAVKTFRKALRQGPDDSGIWNNLGMTYGIERSSVAEVLCYRQAIRHAPQDHGSHLNLGMALLALEDFSQGLKEYEWRLKCDNPLHAKIKGRMVQPGEEASDLIICTEQGLGDVIHFSRFIYDLRERLPSTKITLACPEKLAQLLEHSLPVIDSVIKAESADFSIGETLYLPIMSIPYYLGINPHESVSPSPYLRIPATTQDDLREKAREGLPTNSILIALNWKGNPETEKTNLSGRSMSLQDLESLAELLPSARFVSVQKGHGSEELDSCTFRDRFIDCQQDVSDDWDFVHTAGYLLAADHVISTDTCNAHLAGALGQKTHLLSSKNSEWRWRSPKQISPWYPNLRVYSQFQEKCWQKPIGQIAAYILGEANI